MKKIFIQIGFEAIGDTEEEAIAEAVDVERYLNKKYDNQTIIFAANESGGVGIGKNIIDKIAAKREEALWLEFEEQVK